MPTLHEVQAQFAAALRAPASMEPPPWLAHIGLAVYRNNLREGARKALAADYPVIERLVGAACFRQLALDYVAQHPSRCGDLQDFGVAFPSFLTARYTATDYGYLADLARLEHSLVEGLIAADGPTLTLAALSAIPPSDFERLHVLLQPAARVLSSPYPIFTLWQAHQPADHEPEIIDLARGTQQVLVRREAGAMFVQRIDRSDYVLFDALSGGLSFATACTKVLDVIAADELSGALIRLFDRRLVAGLVLTS